MSMNDPISDMLARIRNGQHAAKTIVPSPWSTVNENILSVLKDEGFIRGYKTVDLDNNKKNLEIELKYDGTKGVIHQLERVSKPGRRFYSKSQNLPPFHNGLGILIVSTPKGMMTDHNARAENVGGEVICRVF